MIGSSNDSFCNYSVYASRIVQFPHMIGLFAQVGLCVCKKGV